jgi:hypothetical protein
LLSGQKPIDTRGFAFLFELVPTGVEFLPFTFDVATKRQVYLAGLAVRFDESSGAVGDDFVKFCHLCVLLGLPVGRFAGNLGHPVVTAACEDGECPEDRDQSVQFLQVWTSDW